MGRGRRARRHRGPGGVPRPGRRRTRCTSSSASWRSGPAHGRRTPPGWPRSAAPTRPSWPARSASGALDDRADEVRQVVAPRRPLPSSRSPTRVAELDCRTSQRARAAPASRLTRRSSRSVEAAVDVDDLGGRLGEPVGQQGDAAAGPRPRRRPRTSQPSGLRSSHTSSNLAKPGIDLAARVRTGPGGDEVDADALGPEVAGQVARRSTRGRPWPRPSSRRRARPGGCCRSRGRRSSRPRSCGARRRRPAS